MTRFSRIARRIASPPPLTDFFEIEDFPRFESGKDPIEVNPPGPKSSYKKFFAPFHLDVQVIRISEGGEESSRRSLVEKLQPIADKRPNAITLVELNHPTFTKGPEWLVHDAVGHMSLDLPVRASPEFKRAVWDAIVSDYKLDTRLFPDPDSFLADFVHFFFGLVPTDLWSGSGDRSEPRSDRIADIAVRYFVDNGKLFRVDSLDNVPLIPLRDAQGDQALVPETIESQVNPHIQRLAPITGKPGLPACTELMNLEIMRAYQAVAQYLEKQKGKLVFNFPESWHKKR
jgi:hypothetical protein